MEVAILNSSEANIVDPVSFRVKYLFQVSVIFALCELVCAFGIAANIANIVVFVRQGLKESINISLLGLAIADLACVATQFWSSFCDNPLMGNPDMMFCAFHVVYYTTAWSHVCFNRISSAITAFITLERCLCVVLPLSIKNILNITRTKIINISIFLVMFILFSPFYFVNRLELQFNQLYNRTRPILVYSEDRILVETVTFVIHSVAMSSFCLLSVIVSTIILITQLKKKAKWREASTGNATTTESSTSARDTKVVKMVTLIAAIFIVCFLPGTANFFVMAYSPEFSVTGKYQNLFYSIWSVTILVESVSSSANIFIYVKMSSKFKIMFLKTFCSCRLKN